MSDFNYKNTYKLIKVQQKKPLRVFYLSIPKGVHLNIQTKKLLINSSSTKIYFLNEKALIKRLSKNPKLNHCFNYVISLSKRGEYVYKNLCIERKQLSQYPHYNVKISRGNRVGNFPTNINGNILIVDDIFCSGITLSRIIAKISKSAHIICAVLFGPCKTIREFKTTFKNVGIIQARLLPYDPRKFPANFTDWYTLVELARKYKKKGILLKRLFKEKLPEILTVLK